MVSSDGSTSCATQPIRAPRARRTDPSADGCSISSRMIRNRVDLPVPLRPTSPTFQPAEICAEALANSERPPMR